MSEERWIDYLISINSVGFQSSFAEQVWNHQQNKLDQKDKRIAELEGLLREGCSLIKNNVEYNEDTWVTKEILQNAERDYRECGSIDPDSYIHALFYGFLNKPEIKKLLEKV